MSFEFAERDLQHIRNVLGYLERSADFVRQTEANAVISLGYWRARVRAIQVMPLLPMHIDKQAKELLGRLDRLESAREGSQSGTKKKPEARPLASMY
ncbi:MAG TPA: hypothetical protein VG320_03940 [Paraburkholderia sp.]|uniref:hypothetical protein n=1 Tax=Paraburkholderia sp. TaxID=1926495 RepID=UPI002DF27079|nr:hypothetical protein [Paraburkholderia sp.]